METVTARPYSEAQRMEMRSLVNLAGEVIAYYWPMRTFIHHNLLHGLEYLEFEEAVQQGQRFLGGRPYLPNEVFRDYFRTGRIRIEEVDAALQPFTQDKTVLVGNTRITHLEVLRAHLLQGLTAPNHMHQPEAGDPSSEDAALATLTDRLRTILPSSDHQAQVQTAAEADIQALGHDMTVSAWCDRVLGTRIVEQINEELIKWCGAFVDEDHAAWTMPARDLSLYTVWKQLAQHDFSSAFLGIPDWKHKIQALPERSEDSLLMYLEILGIPKALWEDYLSLHLGTMPGWTGFIKWRAEETGYEWQERYPVSLVKYLAIRLFYEGELVRDACRVKLNITGDYPALVAFMREQPHVYSLRQARVTGSLTPEFRRQVDRLRYGSPRDRHAAWRMLADRYHTHLHVEDEHKKCQSHAWRLLRLADMLQIPPQAMIDGAPGELQVLLRWLDDFPETRHGPVWLQAFEAGYRQTLLETLKPNIRKSFSATDLGQGSVAEVRPLTQAIFCIDVRSEGFRRHLEEIGGYETLGFAGFFAIPFRFRPFGSHHETDQCPVLLKPKHIVREVPRAYQSLEAEKHLAGKRFLQTGHQLLYDLKENVITPYVMVEAM
ncbi:MAG: DUF2309 family protein, partial [Nitrospirales bacterium]|nr:DUF2309 family protein [Nitrospirales bacterium]